MISASAKWKQCHFDKEMQNIYFLQMNVKYANAVIQKDRLKSLEK